MEEDDNRLQELKEEYLFHHSAQKKKKYLGPESTSKVPAQKANRHLQQPDGAGYGAAAEVEHAGERAHFGDAIDPQQQPFEVEHEIDEDAPHRNDGQNRHLGIAEPENATASSSFSVISQPHTEDQGVEFSAYIHQSNTSSFCSTRALSSYSPQRSHTGSDNHDSSLSSPSVSSLQSSENMSHANDYSDSSSENEPFNPPRGPEENLNEADPLELPAAGDALLYPLSHRKLRNKTDEEFSDPVNTTSTASRNDLLYMLLAMAKKNKFTNQAFSDAVNLVNAIFPTPVLPTSKYLIDQLVISNVGVRYIFYCKECMDCFGKLDYLTIKIKLCENCNTENILSDLRSASFFVTFDLPPQLQVLFSNPDVLGSLFSPKDAIRRDPGSLSDVYDGSMYKSFAAAVSHYPECIISFSFCTDGSPLFVSSSCSFWGIILIINELPPEVRMHTILTGGLWFGVKKPPMDLFLRPFVEHMNHLSNGFKIDINHTLFDMRAFLIGCCVDSGARGQVQGIKTHGGYCSCNWCHVHGKYVDGAVRYVITEERPPERKHDEVVRHQVLLADNNESVSLIDSENSSEHENEPGITALTPLTLLPGVSFDIVQSFFVEYMHAVNLRISKYYLNKWLTNSDADYYIDKDQKYLVDDRIKKLRPPLEIRRFPRPLHERKRWKAREYEYFLLFYAVPLLMGILPRKYIMHWLLLAQSIFLLSQTVVQVEHVNLAHDLIAHFMVQSQVYYGESIMTFNMHLLSHLAAHVSRWGPLWAGSGYCFEWANGKIKEIIHSQQGIPHQVIRAMSWEQALQILERHASDKAKEFVKVITIKKNKFKQSTPVGSALLLGKPLLFTPTEEETFLCTQADIDVRNCESYVKVIKDRCVFEVFNVKTTRSDNSAAQLLDSSFVIIKKILFHRDSNAVFILVLKVHCNPLLVPPDGVNIKRTDHFMWLITSVDDECSLIPIYVLKTVCFKANFTHGDFIAPVPNIMNTC